MTIHWKAFEQYFTAVRCSPACHFGKLNNAICHLALIERIEVELCHFNIFSRERRKRRHKRADEELGLVAGPTSLRPQWFSVQKDRRPTPYPMPPPPSVCIPMSFNPGTGAGQLPLGFHYFTEGGSLNIKDIKHIRFGRTRNNRNSLLVVFDAFPQHVENTSSCFRLTLRYRPKIENTRQGTEDQTKLSCRS